MRHDSGYGGGGGGSECGGFDLDSPDFDSVPDGSACTFDSDCEDFDDYCDPEACVCTNDNYDDPILVLFVPIISKSALRRPV